MKKYLSYLLCFILILSVTACGEKKEPDNAETPIIEDGGGLSDEVADDGSTDDGSTDDESTDSESTDGESIDGDNAIEGDTIEDIEEETLLGEGYDNPLKVGDSINFQYIDYMHSNADVSLPIADCIITYNSYEDGVVHITFEVLSYSTDTAVVVNDSLGSLYYHSIDEDMARTFIFYEDVYKEDDGSNYFSVYESGKVDYCVKIESGSYLTLDYVPPTENNLNKEKNEYYVEDSIWFELK